MAKTFKELIKENKQLEDCLEFLKRTQLYKEDSEIEYIYLKDNSKYDKLPSKEDK